MPWSAAAFASVKGVLHQPEAKPTLKQETREAILLAVAKARARIDGIASGCVPSFADALQTAAVKTPGMGFPFVGYQSNVPQLDIQVDRVKAKAQGVALTNLFETLQVYLGSSYVNDFNLFGRTWRVYAQADGDFRKRVEDIAILKTRNDRGEMVPIGSMVKISQTYGPDRADDQNAPHVAVALLGDRPEFLLAPG